MFSHLQPSELIWLSIDLMIISAVFALGVKLVVVFIISLLKR
jgi:hypothetical protein